ncbi:MAG TPA: hypothetical protein PKC29_03580 [Thermodesulfobacteriota bacterium]|nr:hypothetical protein [Thermodesulfobacteriota bacterium]
MSKVLKVSLPFVTGALFAFVIMSSFNLFQTADAQPPGYYQPNMEQALGNLHAARINLEVSSPDKGGHRVKALELVNQAIYQVRQGIAFSAE